MRARHWAEGAGAALLLMLPFFYPLVTPGNIALYHHELPIGNLIGGVLLDLAALSVVFALGLVLLLRLPARVRLMTGAVLAAVTLWRAGLLAVSPLKSESNLDAHGPGNFHDLTHIVQTGLALNRILAVGLALVFLLLAVIKPSIMRSLIRATRIGLAGFAFSIVWLAPQLVYLAIRSAEPVTRAAEVREAPVATSRAPEGRLVWILFDELSYRLVYDQRPAGQEFPNFERLREQSLSFDNIDPAGFYTDRIIPSLLAGTEMDEIRSTAQGELEYLGPGHRHWEAFDAGSSLFGLADRNGWKPGVAGWWNPYCRDFASVLAECSWRAGPTPMETIDASSQSVTANALVLPEYLLARVGLAQSSDSQTDRRHNIADYLSLMNSARGLIQNQQIHFVFLHLPVPHPPGIYDRDNHRLRAGGNYLDNLTLADDTLGELMQEIAASPDGNRTTVIVSSDHSWRVRLWDSGPAWTKEEEEVSHGSFDPRPVFLIHFPDQASGAEVNTQVPELEEHEIVAAILNRHIENEAQLAALLRSDKIKFAGNEEIRPESGQ